MSKAILPFALLLLACGSIEAVPGFVLNIYGPLQSADAAFDTSVLKPAYLNRHPRVLFDQAHNNLYTSTGRYKPFRDLMVSDGYRVVPSQERFSRSLLTGYDVLVIVDAAGPKSQRDASAFTGEECDAVQGWVKAGGALLLITGHAPFGSAVSQLAGRFGVDVTKGHTIESSQFNKESGDQTELVFARDNGLLGEHPVLRGRDKEEQIDRILSFSGTSLKGPGGSVALLKLADTAKDVLPPDRKVSSSGDAPVDYRTVSARGRTQGLALVFGKGRVIVFGEAAMLTAQVTPNGIRYGMNNTGIDNRQLALNAMHWLSGLLK